MKYWIIAIGAGAAPLVLAAVFIFGVPHDTVERQQAAHREPTAGECVSTFLAPGGDPNETVDHFKDQHPECKRYNFKEEIFGVRKPSERLDGDAPQTAVQDNQVVVGMTKQQVQATWGPPHRVHAMYSRGRAETEQWDYDYDISGQTPRGYVTFEDGIVTDITISQ